MTNNRKQFRIVKTGNGTIKLDQSKLHEVIGESNSKTTSDGNFLFTQHQPSDEWHIIHDLQKFPSATVIDSAGTKVEGEVIYSGISKVIIKFNGAFSGTATLN